MTAVSYQSVEDNLQALLNLASNRRSMQALAPDARKEVAIHLDINGTLILSDQAAEVKKDSRGMINQALARRLVACWPRADGATSTPLSYYDFVYNVAVPGEVQDPKLKPQRDTLVTHFEDFVREQGLPFHELLQKVISVARDRLTMMEYDGKKIVPSFYRMVELLKEHNISFSIVLRTFGKDLAATQSEIEQYTTIQFANKVDLTKPELYDPTGAFKPEAFTHFASSLRTHTLVQDFFNRWQQGGHAGPFGKPFPVVNTSTAASIMFDDNAESPKLQRKVKVIVGPKDSVTGKDEDVSLAKRMGVVIQADALEALFDPFYFSDRVIRVLNPPATVV